MSLFGRMVAWLLGKSQARKSITGPDAGSIFSFQTSPFSEFSPSETGRFAAFKVLGSNKNIVTVAVLDGIWTSPPALSEANAAAILREHRFAAAGNLAVFGVFTQWWNPGELKGLTLLGAAPVSTDERLIAKPTENFEPGSSHSTLDFVSYHAEGEWRWAHDRELFLAEQEKAKAKAVTRLHAREHQHQTRLQRLTWDQLLAETPFQNWSPSPPYPPEKFTTAARAAIHKACADLKALGPKPERIAVSAVLQGCVTWFNEADARFGGVIETEEREDICAALEEMAFVAGHRDLVDEIDAWREW